MTLTADQVRELQTAMNAKGASLVVDGDFGERTKTAAYDIIVGTPASASASPLNALLDAIATGESRGDYNAIYSGAVHIVGHPKLTTMSLDEIWSLQRRMLAGGSPSTALGRYQFIRATLQATQNEMGVNGRDVWSALLQDAMAVHLLEKRGLKQYLAGMMTINTFANNLAKEWASVCVVNDTRGAHRDVKAGETFYAGDGLNKAFHKPEEILALLRALKA